MGDKDDALPKTLAEPIIELFHSCHPLNDFAIYATREESRNIRPIYEKCIKKLKRRHPIAFPILLVGPSAPTDTTYKIDLIYSKSFHTAIIFASMNKCLTEEQRASLSLLFASSNPKVYFKQLIDNTEISMPDL